MPGKFFPRDCVRDNEHMSTIFPRVGKKSLGYKVDQVEAFLAAARRAYDQADQHDQNGPTVPVTEGDIGGSVDEIAARAGADTLVAPPANETGADDATNTLHALAAEKSQADEAQTGAALTAEGIRHIAFAMHKDGYSPEHVDAALERLEDAFAARERDQAALAGGEQAWLADAENTADALVARLSRAPGHRFTRTTVLAVGYKRVDVDRLANKLVKYFQDGRELTVDDVRTSVFRPERGGYREAQVDLVLDSVVDVMLAVR